MNGWKVTRLGVSDGDPDFRIQEVVVFQERWQRLPVPSVRFQEPLYGNWHNFGVYELAGKPHIRFAAAELSNTIWGFLVPT